MRKKRGASMERFCAEAGLSISPLPARLIKRDQDTFEVFEEDFELLKGNSQYWLGNVLDGQTPDGRQVRIMDWEFRSGFLDGERQTNCAHCADRGCAVFPDVELPQTPCSLRRTKRRRTTPTRKIDFASDEEFAELYLVRGEDKAAVRRLFTPTVRRFFTGIREVGWPKSGGTTSWSTNPGTTGIRATILGYSRTLFVSDPPFLVREKELPGNTQDSTSPSSRPESFLRDLLSCPVRLSAAKCKARRPLRKSIRREQPANSSSSDDQSHHSRGDPQTAVPSKFPQPGLPYVDFIAREDISAFSFPQSRGQDVSSVEARVTERLFEGFRALSKHPKKQVRESAFTVFAKVLDWGENIEAFVLGISLQRER